MPYSFSSTDKEECGLHDCRATAAKYMGDQLVFCFQDGIYCHVYSNDWSNTGEAEVEFKIDPNRGVTCYRFVETEGQVIRKEHSIGELVERINRQVWELEFGYRYDGYEEILYTCWIWERQEPWRAYACELFIGTKENAVFRWDALAKGG